MEFGDGSALVTQGDPTFVPGATPSGAAAISLDGGARPPAREIAAEGDSLLRSNADGLSAGPLPEGDAPRRMYFLVDYEEANSDFFCGVAYGTGAPIQAFGLTVNGNDDALTVQGWGSGNNFRASDPPAVGDNDGSTGDDWFIQSVRHEGDVLRHYRDDVLIDTEMHEFATEVSKFVVGEEIAGAGFTALDMAAVLIYDRDAYRRRALRRARLPLGQVSRSRGHGQAGAVPRRREHLGRRRRRVPDGHA